MNNKYIVITTDCVSAFITIIILIFVLIIYSILIQLDYTNMEGIGNNWKLGPIQSFIYMEPLTTETENSNELQVCPGKSQLIITDYWPGTHVGCSCPNSTVLYDKYRTNSTKVPYFITPDECFRNKFYSKQCNIIPERQKQRYATWRHSTLCGTREIMNYFDLNLVLTKEICTSIKDKKVCGIVDSLGNYLCVNSNIDCPINNIKIVEKGSGGLNSAENGLKVIDLGEKLLVYSNTSPDKPLVIEFKLSENQPCSDQNYVENSISYILDRFYQKNSCKASSINPPIDNRYNQIDTYDYINLMKDNFLLQAIVGLPDFQIHYQDLLKQKQMKLYSRNYIGVSPFCRQKALNLFLYHDEIINNFVNIKNFVDDKFMPNLIKNVAITFIILMFAFLMLKLALSRWYYNEEKRIYKFRRLINIILIYCYVTIILFCIMFIAQVYQLTTKYSWIIDSPDCTDTITYQLVNHFHDDIAKTIGFIAGILFGAIVLLSLIFMENYLTCCGDIEDKSIELENEKIENDDDSSFIMKEKEVDNTKFIPPKIDKDK